MKSIDRRQALVAIACASAAGMPTVTFAAGADRFPDKPVHLVVAFSPGGPVDTVARLLGKELSDMWGRPVVVENRPGAAGNIAASAVAKSPPDGHTLLVTDVALLVSSLMRNSQQADVMADLTPLTKLVAGPMVLVVATGFQGKTFVEMMALAKAQPKKLSYASVGNGSISHLASEMLNTAGGVDVVHIPYQGAGQLLPDLMSGTVDMAFLGIAVSLPLIQAGKLRGLAVSGAKRAALLPDLPAIGEIYPGYEVNSWYGMFAPLATPADLLAKIQQDCAVALNRPEVAKNLRGRGSEIEASTPQAFARKLKEEAALFAPAVKGADLQSK